MFTFQLYSPVDNTWLNHGVVFPSRRLAVLFAASRRRALVRGWKIRVRRVR